MCSNVLHFVWASLFYGQSQLIITLQIFALTVGTSNADTFFCGHSGGLKSNIDCVVLPVLLAVLDS